MADDNIVDLIDIRQHRQSYVDYDRISNALSELREVAGQITRESVGRFGAVDPLAHEICSLTNALDRATMADGKTKGQPLG